MRKSLFSIFSFILLLGAFSPLQSQEVLEKIVAIVGDKVILRSEFNRALRLMAMQRGVDFQKAQKNEGFKEEVLQDLITDKILLIKAEEENLSVEEEKVNEVLNQQLNKIKQSFASQEEYKRQLKREGLTEEKLLKSYRKDARNYLLKQKVMSSLAENISISAEEIEEFFRTHSDSLIQPERVKISHIMLKLPSREEEAYEKILEIKEKLEKGENFSKLAEKYSQGPSSQYGGDLGFIERGTIAFPNFEQAAFSLEKAGQISDIVKTELGYHIIKLEEKASPDSIRVRHILIRSGPTQEDVSKAFEKLRGIKEKISKGASFAKMAAKYSQDKGSSSREGLLGWFQINELPQSFKSVVDTLRIGEVSSPFISQFGVHLLKLDDREKRRPMELKRDYEALKQMLRARKLKKAFDRMIASKKKEVYIDVRL